MESIAERVTTELRDAVVFGELPPGSSFSAQRFADDLGISIIPVRESIRHLEAQGLLVARRGRSALVPPLDAGELRSIYRLRRRLEPDLLAEACRSVPASRIDALEAEVGSWKGVLEPNERSTGTAFRNVLLDLLEPLVSAWETRILDMLWAASGRYFSATSEYVEVDPVDHLVTCLLDLAGALRTGDPHLVRDRFARHLSDWESLGLEGLERRREHRPVGEPHRGCGPASVTRKVAG